MGVPVGRTRSNSIESTDGHDTYAGTPSPCSPAVMRTRRQHRRTLSDHGVGPYQDGTTSVTGTDPAPAQGCTSPGKFSRARNSVRFGSGSGGASTNTGRKAVGVGPGRSSVPRRTSMTCRVPRKTHSSDDTSLPSTPVKHRVDVEQLRATASLPPAKFQAQLRQLEAEGKMPRVSSRVGTEHHSSPSDVANPCTSHPEDLRTGPLKRNPSATSGDEDLGESCPWASRDVG